MARAGRIANRATAPAARKKLWNRDNPAALSRALYSVIRASTSAAASPIWGRGSSSPAVRAWKFSTPQAANAARNTLGLNPGGILDNVLSNALEHTAFGGLSGAIAGGLAGDGALEGAKTGATGGLISGLTTGLMGPAGNQKAVHTGTGSGAPGSAAPLLGRFLHSNVGTTVAKGLVSGATNAAIANMNNNAAMERLERSAQLNRQALADQRQALARNYGGVEPGSSGLVGAAPADALAEFDDLSPARSLNGAPPAPPPGWQPTGLLSAFSAEERAEIGQLPALPEPMGLLSGFSPEERAELELSMSAPSPGDLPYDTVPSQGWRWVVGPDGRPKRVPL